MYKSIKFLYIIFLCFAALSCTSKNNYTTATPASTFAATSDTIPKPALSFYAEALSLWPDQILSVEEPFKCERPKEAVLLLDKSIEIAPTFADAYTRRGLAKIYLKMREEAFLDLSQSIRLSAQAETYAYRAVVSLLSGMPEAARKDLEYSSQIKAGLPLTSNIFGTLALYENNKTEACSYYQDACKKGDCSFLEAAKNARLCR